MIVMQAVVQDHTVILKKLKAKLQRSEQPTVTALAASDSNDHNNYNNPGNEPILPPGIDILSSTLPVHAKLFEQHRVQGMKRLFRDLLRMEVQYHAHAIEAYSQLLECLHAVDATAPIDDPSQPQ